MPPTLRQHYLQGVWGRAAPPAGVRGQSLPQNDAIGVQGIAPERTVDTSAQVC